MHRRTQQHTISALLFLLCCSAAFAQKTPKPIDEPEIRKFLVKSGECTEDQIYFWKLDHFDFKHDGTGQAIVIASTCMTGTAGPDVHSVFARDSSGQLLELRIPEAPPGSYDNMFGNRNYDLTAEDGLLVATFNDDQDRDTPLIIKYQWNGQEFAIIKIQKTGVFETSYDCAKAQKEDEQAICHVDFLAELDVNLNDLYKSLLAKLPTPDRETLRTEQRDWLAQRSKSCIIYKAWVNCLATYYQQRIDALKKRLAPLTPAPTTPPTSQTFHPASKAPRTPAPTP
jgi:uncharacterized protein YecT (DUF1311 family)